MPDRPPVVVHAAPLVLPVVAEPVAEGAVAVAGGRILDVGRRDEVLSAHQGARVREWPGVLLPGLVNAHAHLQYTDFDDLASSGLPFPAWIRALTARRRSMDDTGWQASARRGLHRALASGTTCIADVVTDACVLAPTARTGVAGISYLEAVGADDRRWADGGRARLLAALGSAPAGRAVGVSPHTLYTVGTGVLRDCLRIARERGLRVHTHLAETADEVEYVLAGAGPLAAMTRTYGLDFELVAAGGSGGSPATLLRELGGTGPDVHVAHGVHVDAADRALLRDAGTSVALCVRSNEILGTGEPPVAAYLAEGSPVCVGTDSLASSPSMDLLAELASVRRLALAQGAPPAGLSRRLVEVATIGGATALGLDDIGVLRVGARADLTVVDVLPEDGDDPWDALVRDGAGRCVATVLAGRVVHRRPSPVGSPGSAVRAGR